MALAEATVDETPDGVDPRLPRWAQGELTTDEVAKLEADAARDPNLAADLELYRPYDAAALTPVAEGFGPGDRRRAPGRRYAMAGLAAAAAAAVVTVSVSGPEPIPPLEGYALAIEGGGAAEVRGETDPEDAAWRWDGPVTLLLTPTRAVAGEVALTVFVSEGDGWIRRDVTASPTAEGSFEVVTRVRDLFSGPGRHRLACVLARPGADPDPDAPPDTLGVQVVRRAVQVVDDHTDASLR